MKKNEKGDLRPPRSVYLKIARIMKLIIFLLTAFCLQVAARTYSQDRITLKMNAAAIKKVLFAIEKKTNYRFLFSEEIVRDQPLVNVNVVEAPIEQVMGLVLYNTGISYKIINENLVVLKQGVSASDITVKEVRVNGKVISASGEPLIGVSVNVKGASIGTTTNADGNYSLSVPDDAILVFSYVGYVPIEEPVNGRSVINITMQVSTQTLDQVVVVGYGTQRKKDLTGSISSVKGDELAKMPSTNPISSLQGKVPGLTVSNSGRAGSSPVVRVRGVNSTTNANPVYVVDGLLVDNIDFLNPLDIETIDVLKDPSSIAIYGLRAANGVIAVTTKKASRGKTRISVQSIASLQKVQDKIDVTDAAGFITLFKAQEQNLNVPVNNRFNFANFTADMNWQDEIFRTAFMTSNNVSVSNSGEKTTTYLNIGYTDQDGVLRNDSYKRYLLHLTQEIRINRNIKVGGDITGYHAAFNPPSASITHALWAAPVFPVRLDESTYYSPPSFQSSSISNPVATIMRNDRNSINKNYRAVGNLFAEVKFLKSFTWRSTVYGDLNFYTTRSYTRLPFKFINLSDGSVTYDNNARTSVTQIQGEDKRFQQDHTLTFDKNFGNGHLLTAVAGVTTLYNHNTVVDVTARDTSLYIPDNTDLWYLGIVTSPATTINRGTGTENALFGSFLRAAYSYKGKYLLNATIRRDGSSKFASDHRWITVGSVGVGWVLSDEEFFEPVGIIDFLKLRAAWGRLANSNGIPDNLYLPGLQNGQGAIFGDNVYPSIVAAYRPDPDLGYEIVGGIDAGFDIRLLKNRLFAEVSFYNKTTTDILTGVTLPGLDIPYYTNLGKITNKGIEVNAGWNDHLGKNLTYRVSANFSYNKNVVNAIGDKFDYQLTGNGGVNLTTAGRSIGYFYGYTQVGIYQSTADLAKVPAFTTSQPGDIAYADLNGDGIISSADRGYLGSPFPAYSFGGSVSLAYKAFDFLFEGQGSAGHKIYAQRRTANFTSLNYEANRLNAWTGPGTSNIEPILDNSRGNNFLMSTYYLEPGDFFRIRTLQVGYNFDPRLLARAGIMQARIFVSGQNIKTWSKVTGYSPEPLIGSILGGGADNGSYPVPAIYSVGLNLTF